MTIPNRTVSIKNVFASNANTTIPTPPAAGVSYRNTGTTATEIGDGWPYKEIVDSAKFNQAMYEYTTICQQVEKYGFLPWSANTDYPAQGCALGSDGIIYQAKQASGPSTTAIDPTTDTNHTYWDLFYYADVTANRALVSNASGKMAASAVTNTELGYLSGVTSAIQTQINNKASNNAVVHIAGTETITGAKTFSSQIIASAGNGIQIKGTNHNYVMRSSGSPYEGCGLFLDNDITKKAFNANPTQITIGSNAIPAYANVPSGVTTSTSNEQIATCGWVNTVGNNVVHRSGNETIFGTKTFSSTIAGSINGNAATVTNGVYTTGNQTIGGTKTFSAVAYGKASDADNSILTTVSHRKGTSSSDNANGYFKLGNGMIIQWGRTTDTTNQTKTITFPVAFTSTNYSITATANNQNSSYSYDGVTGITDRTTTSCKVFSWYATRTYDWLAIGY